ILAPRFNSPHAKKTMQSGLNSPDRLLVVMAMAVMTMMLVMSVGAVLWFERFLYRRQMGAQPAQHVPEHVVAANAQRAAGHLQVGMTIADVPGEPREF